MSLESEVSRFIEKNIDAEKGMLVAFSGGADSLSLLTALSRSGYAQRTVACYVNHNIRDKEELADEIRLATGNAALNGVRLVIEELPQGAVSSYREKTGCGTEAAARALRYERLEEVRKRMGLGYILSAHNRDDNDETTLMRLMRGSLNLSIPQVRDNICRPLLNVTRAEIEAYLNSLGFVWSTDSTNLENNYLRNKVRNKLMPVVREIWPSYRKSLEALRIRTALIERDEYRDFAEIFRAWDEVSEDELSLNSALSILELMKSPEGGKAVIGDVTVEKSKGKLIYSADPSASDFSCELSPAGGTYELSDGKKLYWGEEAVCFYDSSDAKLSVWLPAEKYTLRSWKDGDRIEFANGSKRVCRMLQDMGIAQVSRRKVPVIALGDRIVAVLARAYGGKDRISPEFRQPAFAVDGFNLYIIR